jgi:RNA polymerase-binding transcription factor DksA
MPDDYDVASEVELAQREKAIAETRARNAPETHPDFDGTHCVDCDDEIPEQRLFLGKVRCVVCQGRLERR